MSALGQKRTFLDENRRAAAKSRSGCNAQRFQTVFCTLVRGVDLKSPAEVRNGAVIFAPVCVREAPHDVGVGILRLERNELVVVGNCAVELAFRFVDHAPEKDGPGIFRAERDELGKIGDLAVNFAVLIAIAILIGIGAREGLLRHHKR